MAHTKSARKRIRQDRRRNERNQSEKSRIRTLTKQFRTALAGSDAARTESSLKEAVRAHDKAASKGVVHRKTASRKSARLARAAHKKLSSTAQEAQASS